MSAYAYAGTYLILVALLILAVGIASQLRQQRDDARDLANEADDNAATWHAAARLHEANVAVLRGQLADAETLLTAAAFSNARLTDEASRSLPRAPRAGEPLRADLGADPDADHTRWEPKPKKPRAVRAVKSK